MKPTLTLAAALLLFACNNPASNKEATTDSSAAASSDTITKDDTWVPADSATAMKAWMDFATPGSPHQMLAESDGEWTATIKHWQGAEAPADSATGSSINKMILGGRYQLSHFKSSFMGMPFEGTSTMGYDNTKKLMISTWVDNMGTGIMVMEGPWDSTAKTITLTGSMIDPSNGKKCDTKEIYTYVDKDHHLMEMFGPDPQTGKQYKNMEITFTRK